MPATLCSRCRQQRFWEPDFHIEERSDKLYQDSRSCDLCKLLWQAFKSLEGKKPDVASFQRAGSTINVRGAQSRAVLSILRNPGTSYSHSGLQIGFPQLSHPDSDISSLIRQRWLHECDSNHTGCRFTGNIRLPTRLIDLGTAQVPIVRLVETSGGLPGDNRFVALSHRWGDTEKHRPFCTRLQDVNGHDLESFKRAIPEKDLPKTFRDAITTTRRLGIRYLWIDSLCIIQGDGGDFSTEAKRMEDVFSCAYCVIAASRASNQLEGFLRDRPQRRFIHIPQGREDSIYICEAIDDFGRHVLDGALNRRGWVLQERALARRTIYFTDAQTYFECGKGVRCETLARMQNNMAEFLGDPRFPEKAMRENSRAIKIRYFQDLYRRYSQLGFTHIQDRPIAIAGLENRLRKAYWTKGGFGIFDDGPGHGLFHRSLLWMRGDEEPSLKPIDFTSRPESAAPTWSWMAHEGGIDYLDPPFQQMDWEQTEIKPSWSVTGGGSDGYNPSHLKVVVRLFDVAGAPGRKTGDVRFIYDNPNRKASSDRQGPMCVVIAKEKKDKPAGEKRHYVLVVSSSPGATEQGQKLFTRLGVGYMPGSCIMLEGNGIRGIVR